MKKTISILSSFFLVVIITTTTIYAEEQVKEPDLYARSALLMDAESGRVLFEKDGFSPMAVASTTKIMTAVLVIENADMESYAQVSAKAASQPKVKLYVKEGECYKVKDLLYSLLLESHNDTAVVLAENIAGSTEKFAEMMNKKAEELGCRNTFFITPNGLDDTKDGRKNEASAYDMALITRYALKNEIFKELIKTKTHTFSDKTGKRTECVNNANRFLDMYEGAIGVKTGFTNLAGYCFVGAIQTQDTCLISVVLGSGWPPYQKYKWSDTSELMEYGKDNYQRTVLRIPSSEGYVSVKDGEKDYITVRGDEVQISYPICNNDIVKEVILCEHLLPAPIEKGRKTGWKRIYVNEECVLEMSIFAVNNCPQKKFSKNFIEILHRFYI